MFVLEMEPLWYTCLGLSPLWSLLKRSSETVEVSCLAEQCRAGPGGCGSVDLRGALGAKRPKRRAADVVDELPSGGTWLGV